MLLRLCTGKEARETGDERGMSRMAGHWRLKKEFEYIRGTFFPKWYEGKRWRIKKGPLPPPAQGWCKRERREITIGYIPTIKNSLYSLLIHETCHAITYSYHGKRFQERMLKAARGADRIGNAILGNMIRHDLNRIRQFERR